MLEDRRRKITTYNANPHAPETAELARWLWPGNVSLDWDGRVVVAETQSSNASQALQGAQAPLIWRLFDPFEEFDACGRALDEVQQRRLMPALGYELELQLNKVQHKPFKLEADYHWAKKFIQLNAARESWTLDFFIRLVANMSPEQEVEPSLQNRGELSVAETAPELNRLLNMLMKGFQALPSPSRQMMVLRHNLQHSHRMISFVVGQEEEEVERGLADGAGEFCSTMRKYLRPHRADDELPIFVLGYLREVRRRFLERQRFMQIADRVMRRRLISFPRLQSILVQSLDLMRMDQAQVLLWCCVWQRPADEIESRLCLDRGEARIAIQRGSAVLKDYLEDHPQQAIMRKQLVLALLRLSRSFPLESPQISVAPPSSNADEQAQAPEPPLQSPPLPEKEMGADGED
jgi:DNA-directed RNA polymerase specialized sigma24 family protein